MQRRRHGGRQPLLPAGEYRRIEQAGDRLLRPGFRRRGHHRRRHARTDPLRHPFELQLECRMQLHGRRLDQILPQDRPGRRQGTLLPGGQRCQHPAFGDGRIPLCGRQADRNDPRRQPERQRTLHQVRRQQHRDERDRSGTLCRPLRHQGRVERDAVLRTRKSRMGNLHRDGQRDFHARHRGVSRAAGIPEP